MDGLALSSHDLSIRRSVSTCITVRTTNVTSHTKGSVIMSVNVAFCQDNSTIVYSAHLNNSPLSITFMLRCSGEDHELLLKLRYRGAPQSSSVKITNTTLGISIYPDTSLATTIHSSSASEQFHSAFSNCIMYIARLHFPQRTAIPYRPPRPILVTETWR